MVVDEGGRRFKCHGYCNFTIRSVLEECADGWSTAATKIWVKELMRGGSAQDRAQSNNNMRV